MSATKSLQRLPYSPAVRPLVLFFLISAQWAAAEDEPPLLKGVDVYGTKAFNGTVVREEFRSELASMTDAYNARDREGYQKVKDDIARRLNQRGDFAYLELSVIRYFPPNTGYYLTVDVVERQDASRRMPFYELPESATYDDPGGLIARWQDYAETVHRLAASGDLEYGECEVLHCLVSFGSNAELGPYLPVFNEGAAAHEETLYEILAKGESTLHRSTVVFLLAHTKDVDRLLPVLGRAIYDPNFTVRNNAMRLMAMMAEDDPHLPFPVDDLVVAMDFPATTDRNKATFAVAALAESPEHRAVILETAMPTALRLLRLQQPNNHNAAYALLKAASGEDFGARSYDDCNQWFLKQ